MRLAQQQGLSQAGMHLAARTVLSALLLALLLPSAAANAAPPESEPKAASTRQPPQPGMLVNLHQRLAAVAAGRIPRATVLQIGDSHTAADFFTGRLRERLQARFGNGGRGLLPPGAPYAFYRAEQVKARQTGAWQVLSSNKATPDPAQYGLTGYVLRSTLGDDLITLEDRSGANSLHIGYQSQPASGSFEVIIDGETYGRFTTAAAETGRQVLRLELPPSAMAAAQARAIQLRSYGDGPLDIMDLALDRESGVQVLNAGFIGAQVGILKRWHWPTVRAQLAAIDPALIVLAFGTNEGFAPLEGILDSYEATFEAHVKVLQAAAPAASLVILGPPQAARYPRFCLPPPPPLASQPASPPPEAGLAGLLDLLQRAVRVGVIVTAWPPSEPPDTAVCRPLSAPERQRYEQMLAARDRELCRWHAPPALGAVREIQRRVAARLGLYFFDWSALLDGECGIDRWARQGLAAKDRVHFRQEGYARAADALYDALLAGFPDVARSP